MQGVCRICGEETSTKRTKRCYRCYRKQLWVKRSLRDKKVISDIMQGNLSAAIAARKHNISREMVRLILQDNGIDYAQLLYKRRQAKKRVNENIETKAKMRKCEWCEKDFIVNQKGARVKYCSTNCYETRYKKLQRLRVKAYYKTPKGKMALKKYKQKNKIKIKKYLESWHKQNITSSPQD